LKAAHDRREAVNRTSEAIERDLAELIKRGNDLKRESAELSRAAKDFLLRAAHLKEVLAKQKRPYLSSALPTREKVERRRR
jgi:hypothetical protein